MFSLALKIGTRTSPLALRQTDEVIDCLKEFYPHIEFRHGISKTEIPTTPARQNIKPGQAENRRKSYREAIFLEIVGIDTYGDKDKITPISDIEGTDFFTREIEDALLRGEVDFAVHSAKDLPDRIREGLSIAAVTKSIDASDALVSKNNLTIDRLAHGSRVGASSKRRKEQLKKYRPDLQLVDIRGDIGERLKRLEDGNLDAIVAASCALMRLGLEEKITQRIALGILTPHPLQGSLAVEVRSDNKELKSMLEVLNGR